MEFSLEELRKEIAAINLGDRPPRSPKKLGDGECIIGRMDTELSRIWRLREKYWVALDELVQKMVDECEVYLLEHQSQGSTKKEQDDRFEKKAHTFKEECRPLIMKYDASDLMFEQLAKQALPIPPSKGSILGVRDGNVLIVRKKDDRGDHDHPINSLAKFMERNGFSHLLDELK